jgi:maleate isomerase
VASLTTSGALLEALTELAAHRIALVTPYTVSVIQSLVDMARRAARCGAKGPTPSS